MKTLALSALLLSLAAFSGIAGAHSHPGCGDADVDNGTVHVWTGGACMGATVARAPFHCTSHHLDLAESHFMVLSGYGCETGALVNCWPTWTADPICPALV